MYTIIKMYAYIEKKAKDCDDFLVKCNQWKRECEEQLRDIDIFISQNESMRESFRNILDKKRDDTVCELTLKDSTNILLTQSEYPNTPPTQSSHIENVDDLDTQKNMLIEPSLSPLLIERVKKSEYDTPKKDKNISKENIESNEIDIVDALLDCSEFINDNKSSNKKRKRNLIFKTKMNI
jgi:hypothetical protein